jgi:hypothetical protein
MLMPDIGDPELVQGLQDRPLDIGHGHVALPPFVSGDSTDTINERADARKGLRLE